MQLGYKSVATCVNDVILPLSLALKEHLNKEVNAVVAI